MLLVNCRRATAAVWIDLEVYDLVWIRNTYSFVCRGPNWQVDHNQVMAQQTENELLHAFGLVSGVSVGEYMSVCPFLCMCLCVYLPACLPAAGRFFACVSVKLVTGLFFDDLSTPPLPRLNPASHFFFLP